MALYRIHLVDLGGNIDSTLYVEQEGDQAAIAAAYRLTELPNGARSFQVWDDERLVHDHRS